MARYIVLRVESNQTADTLLERFAVVPAIKVVGLFASPTQFCEGKCDNEGKSIRSKRWGLWFCPVCKKPKSTRMQTPRNLLNDIDLHPRFADMFISVWEPYHGDPVEKYGSEPIERKKEQAAQASERITRHKRRNKRRNRGG